MTAQQIDVIRQSWKHVMPIREVAGELFYTRLFETAPSVRALFPDDVKPQAKKLMAMLGTIVANLDNLAQFLPQVRALATRHNDYGAQPEHYAVVGEALLWTLEKGLGEHWSDEAKAAWTLAFTTLANVMIEAQIDAQAARA
jgi:hemoglobin-like flavoprotein